MYYTIWFVLLACSIQLSVAQDGCQLLTTCLDKVFDERTEQTNARKEKWGQRLQECEPKLKTALNRLDRNQKRRHELVADCIERRSSPDNFRCPPAFIIGPPRTRVARSPFDRFAAAGRGGRNAGGRNRNGRKGGPLKQCRAESKDCPVAKLCHLCYERSRLHDDIHEDKLALLEGKIRCRQQRQNNRSFKDEPNNAVNDDFSFYDEQ